MSDIGEFGPLSQALLMVAGKPKMPEGSAVGAQLVSRHLLRRTMLYEAAHSLLIHSGKWSWLKAWGVRVAQRRGMTSSDRRGRQTSGRGSAPDVGRWSRVPLEQGQCRGSYGCLNRRRRTQENC
jgi:hypothetical protein